MTTLNNYDMSSTGCNIELEIFHDSDAAQCDYNDSITNVRGLLIYTDCGNFDATDFEQTFVLDMPVMDLFAAYFLFYFEKHISLASEGDLEEIQNYLGMDVNESTDVKELNDAIRNRDGRENYVDFMKKRYQPEYFEVTSRGYCQGNVHDVIVPFALLKELGLEVTQEAADKMKEHIDHLLWDQPLYAMLTVDGEEFGLEGFMRDTYSYYEDDVLQAAEKALEGHESRETVMAYLRENMPSSVDYR